MRRSADSSAPKDHARGVNMGDPRRFRLHVQRGNSAGLFRMDLPRNRREHRGPPQGTDSSKHLE
jgi:hypothetical protein